MNTVILAEKPSQALAYAQAFNHSKKEDGFFSIQDSIFKGDTYITFGFGHLVELVAPEEYDFKYKKWNLENLPIFPSEYKFKVPKDKQKQFTIVEKLLKKADIIIIATDSDREGSNIAWSIIHQANAYSNNKTYKRLWINSLEKEAIRQGFMNLKEGVEDIPAYKEAQTRQISDWLIGMNGSPLYSLTLQQKGINDSFSLGRVQTPTLYLIYQRNQAINDFKKEPFYELENVIEAENGTFKANLSPFKRFREKTEINPFLEGNNAIEGKQEGIINNIDINKKKTNSPNLFSLSSLQSKINQLYKASASDTLNAVQSLYEAKLLTYPRTDTPYITNNEFNYLKANLTKYTAFLNVTEPPTQLEPRKRYVDSSKVQEHHAIILTKQVPSKEKFEKLPSLQQKIYSLVAKTTIAMFLPNYEYEETIIEVQTGKLLFKAKGQVPLNQGWKLLFSSEKNNEQTNENDEEKLLPKVNKGDIVQATIKIDEKETTPPKFYTEGTLLTAMKTAGKTVDNEEAIKILQEVEGIGTEATRASIIETLKKKEYITIQKNKVMISEKGIILCQAVHNQHLLTSAEMTAKWETYLKKIGQKQGTQEAFLNNIKKFIVHLVESVPNDIKELNISNYEKKMQELEGKNTIGTCPKCGGNIKLKKSFYGCSNYPECKFTLADNFRNKKLTKSNIKALLQGETTIIKGIKNKEKKPYNAEVKQNDKGYIELVSFVK